MNMYKIYFSFTMFCCGLVSANFNLQGDSTGVVENHIRADSRLAPSQWETALQSNAISHWLGANLESVVHIDGLLQERRNSIANALELRLSCINPAIWLPLCPVK